MTVWTPRKSMPRPTRSVATSSQLAPDRNLSTAALRTDWGWEEWMTSACTPSYITCLQPPDKSWSGDHHAYNRVINTAVQKDSGLSRKQTKLAMITWQIIHAQAHTSCGCRRPRAPHHMFLPTEITQLCILHHQQAPLTMQTAADPL